MQQASLEGYRHAALLPLPDGITANFLASQPDSEVDVMLQLLIERQQLQQALKAKLTQRLGSAAVLPASCTAATAAWRPAAAQAGSTLAGQFSSRPAPQSLATSQQVQSNGSLRCSSAAGGDLEAVVTCFVPICSWVG